MRKIGTMLGRSALLSVREDRTGAGSDVLEELICILRAVSKERNQAESRRFTTPDGRLDQQVLGQTLYRSIWDTYFRFLLSQLMIEHGRTKEADFPFISTITTTVSTKPGGATVKLTPRRGYTYTERMIRERRKWLAQLQRFRKGVPLVADAQSGIGASAFSPALTTLITNDLAALCGHWNGKGL